MLNQPFFGYCLQRHLFDYAEINGYNASPQIFVFGISGSEMTKLSDFVLIGNLKWPNPCENNQKTETKETNQTGTTEPDLESKETGTKETLATWLPGDFTKQAATEASASPHYHIPMCMHIYIYRYV